MSYIKGENRRQVTLFPACLEDCIGEDNPVRVIDSFVNRLNLAALGFQRTNNNAESHPSYDPRDMLKLYVNGYFNKIRSSRYLEAECKRNIELMWLLNNVKPNFRTISDFRKDNLEPIKKTFKEFNKFCVDVKLITLSYVSIDGSKFSAVNSKGNNYTLSKLDDRIARLDVHIQNYLEQLNELDKAETRALSKDELEHKLKVAKERKDRYEGYRKELEESGEK